MINGVATYPSLATLHHIAEAAAGADSAADSDSLIFSAFFGTSFGDGRCLLKAISSFFRCSSCAWLRLQWRSAGGGRNLM